MQKSLWTYSDNNAATSPCSATVGYGTKRYVCPPPMGGIYPSAVFGGIPIDVIDQKVVSESSTVDQWRELQANGQLLPVTKYAVSRQFGMQQRASHIGNCYNQGGSTRYIQTGEAAAISEVSVYSTPQLDDPNLDMLLQAAHAEAQSLGWDILVDLAESKETYALFAKYVKLVLNRRTHIQRLVRKGLTDPKSGRYVRMNNMTKSAKARIADRHFLDHWMESRYAWRPLVFSSEAMVEAIQNWREPEKRLVKVRKSNTVTTSGDAVLTNIRWQRTANVQYPTIDESKYTGTSRGRAFFLGYILREEAKKASLNLNPVSSVEELIPYSFVWNWFFNINELTRAHWPSVRYEQYVAGTSLRNEEMVEINFSHPGDSSHAGCTEGILQLSEDSYARNPAHDIPWDLSFRAKVSPAKLLDLYAMGKNLVKSGMSKSPTLRI